MNDPTGPPEDARAKLGQVMVIAAAEGTVTSARMADLVDAPRAARARWAAAKGRVTRARKDGGADKIAAAIDQENAAYQEYDRIGREAVEEMLALNACGLDNLGEILAHMTRAWEQDAAALDTGQQEPQVNTGQ